MLVLPLHGHLAPAAWAAAQAAPGLQVGYVQTAGGALPGSLSAATSPSCASAACSVATSPPAPAYGGEHEAISASPAPSTPPLGKLGWDAVLVGPGPGSSAPTRARPRRHGGARHRPRGPGPRHADPALAAPLLRRPARAPPRRQPPHPDRAAMLLGWRGRSPVADPAEPVADRDPGDRSGLAPPPPRRAPSTSPATRPSGLPARTMGRGIDEDPLFFAAPLAAGAALRRKG